MYQTQCISGFSFPLKKNGTQRRIEKKRREDEVWGVAGVK